VRLGLWICHIFTVLAFVFSPAPLLAEQAAKHVIMISIDGLRPEIYLDIQAGKQQTPNLVDLRQQGVSARRMIPVFPSVTYPGHTTLVTGVYPAAHGVVSNFKKGNEWYLQSADIKVKTLWQAAREKGLTTAIVTWPASYGAQVDYLIPENLAINTPGVPKLIREGATPGLFEQLESKFGPVQLPSFEHEDAGERLDEMTEKFAAEIIKQHKPDLLLVHFLDADHRQHLDGPDSPQVRSAFHKIDQRIGKLRQAAQDAGILDTTTFVIVGDHGFLPVHTSINVNGLLAATGYGKMTEENTFASSGVIAVPIGGAAAFYLEEPGDAKLAAKVIASFRKELENHYVGLVNFVRQRELANLGAFPGALFALSAREGYMFTAEPTTEPLVPAGIFKGMHGYLPSIPAMATGFIISGAGVRKGIELPFVRMVDVAPTVAAFLGADLGNTVGFPLVGIWEEKAEGKEQTATEPSSPP
jgi:predicted AlkP superfamily pyrophosphatase or phosphodiesterase